MLKYVNSSFQINVFKISDLIAVTCNNEIEAAFKKLIVKTNGIYFNLSTRNGLKKSWSFAKDANWLVKLLGYTEMCKQ